MIMHMVRNLFLGLALLTLSWDKNWDSHSLVNGYPSFYPRIALVAPSPGGQAYFADIDRLPYNELTANEATLKHIGHSIKWRKEYLIILLLQNEAQNECISYVECWEFLCIQCQQYWMNLQCSRNLNTKP